MATTDVRSRNARVTAKVTKMDKRKADCKAAVKLALSDAGDLPLEVRDRIKADIQLQFDHPGQYVAYIDKEKVLKGERRLVRKVVDYKASWEALERVVAELPAEQRQRLQTTYVTDPYGSVDVIPRP